MWDIVLPGLLALCTIKMGYLGMQVTLHPPTSLSEKKEYTWAFIIVGGLSVFLILWQGARSYVAQEENKAEQSQQRFDVQQQTNAAQAAQTR